MRKNKTSGSLIVWVLFVSTFLSFCFFLAGIDSWKFALAGDDWQFYGFALQIVSKHFWLNPFSFAGVYHQNSVLASQYQALFLRWLDASVVSWRLSNVILIIPSSVLFYFFVKLYFGRMVGLYSTILMQFSFFLANYFKMGYINPQAFFLFIVCLFFAASFGLRPMKKTAAFLGVSLGVAFYVYIGPLFPFFVWPYLLPLFHKLKFKRLFVLLLICFGTYVLFLFPLLLNIQSVLGPMHKTTLASEESLKISMSANVLHEFLLFFREYQTYFNHFISGPYVDVVTQVFLVIGMVLSIIFVRKRGYFPLVCSYVVTCVVMGITNVYPLPPVTRGFIVLPFGFIFAGLGLAFAYRKLASSLQPIFLILIFSSILCINFYQSQFGVFRSIGYTTTALVLRTLQDAKIHGVNRVYFFVSPEYSYNNFWGNLEQIRSGYELSEIQLIVIHPGNSACESLQGKPVYVFASDTESRSWLERNPCGKISVNVSVLSPTITFY